ncbi:hypothetical protein HBH56_022360 [Parastagonospora nodorum]|uniref:Uncharacterized protein n=1 Tax=Phaeosphaeria nodorum (strain SN15 / ATCC MYA-4574 / FGSC 10173) TaxID=321614 RepID=A0A7U2HYQ3_PHANO|nr:hypothetical protein HBH56_022360 [Parastagonospora nodorum]QRC95578.1 hypothetical protein JI435_432470 [Parastagonospora nodorum SN15]KAH3936870.1 hypothetical protein HBH54_012120 [Parastagonospora nodorum]KAH4044216.1 hypothetical protein HBH49_221600 [Parastagonospora nodorum]KAH4117049.1 hypothetical protein HBH47_160060 [Parastagonospora nodorum]
MPVNLRRRSNVERVCLQLDVSEYGLDALSYGVVDDQDKRLVCHCTSFVCKRPKRQRISLDLMLQDNHTVLGIAASWARSFSFSVLQEGQELLPSYGTYMHLSVALGGERAV